jgi:hypothetical protein
MAVSRDDHEDSGSATVFGSSTKLSVVTKPMVQYCLRIIAAIADMQFINRCGATVTG